MVSYFKCDYIDIMEVERLHGEDYVNIRAEDSHGISLPLEYECLSFVKGNNPAIE